MDIPEKLFKYRGGSLQDIASVSDGKIWFSRPDQFNDPYDCAHDIVVPPLTRADCEVILERLTGGGIKAPSLAKLSDEKLQKDVATGILNGAANGLKGFRGVSCFSATPRNLLMWGHYSHGHRGFCLEYSITKDSLFKKAFPVRYSDARPAFTVEGLRTGDTSEILNFVLTKPKDWEYEKEWRVFHAEGGRSYGVERSSLTGIYFGAKMPEDQVNMVAFLLSTSDTKLYKMRISTTSFEVVPEPIDFTPIDYRSARTSPPT